MKTRAQKILTAFLKNADAHEIDPNTMEPKPKKSPLSTHWHPEETPVGCNSKRGGKSCQLSGPHSDHQSGQKRWTD